MESPVHIHRITVQQEDLDDLNHVNNVVYVRWVQEAAAAHWNSLASIELKQVYWWVVLRHEIDYHVQAKLGDEILAKTWVQNYDGPRSTRVVQLFRKADNKLVAEAKTTWCLINATTGRPTRVGDDIRTVFTTPSAER